MTDQSNHELISAYLDGELPDDQRQRVERLLAENAQCRQVYDELCALRASLSALPRHRLDEDLAPEVLRRAEQARLERQAADGQVVPSAADRARDRSSRAWRAVLYPILAVAAAIAVMVSSPENKKQPQIAHARAKPAPPAQMSAAADQMAKDEQRPTGSEQFRIGEPDFAAEDAMPDESKQESQLDNDELNSDSLMKDEADRSDLAAKTESLRSAKAGGASGPQAIVSGELEKAIQLPAGIKATLVLQCTLAPAALRDNEFEKLLARNHLQPLTESDVDMRYAQRARDRANRQDLNRKAKADSARPAGVAGQKPDPGMLGGMGARGHGLGRAARDESTDSRRAKSVMVEMNPEQLVAVLADLQSHPEQFILVELPSQAKLAEADRKSTPADDEAADSAAAAPPVDEVAADSDATAQPAAAAGSAADGPAPERGAKKTTDGTETKAAAEIGGYVQLESKPTGSAPGGPPQRLLVLFRLSKAKGR